MCTSMRRVVRVELSMNICNAVCLAEGIWAGFANIITNKFLPNLVLELQVPHGKGISCNFHCCFTSEFGTCTTVKKTCPPGETACLMLEFFVSESFWSKPLTLIRYIDVPNG